MGVSGYSASSNIRNYVNQIIFAVKLGLPRTIIAKHVVKSVKIRSNKNFTFKHFAYLSIEG